MSEILKSKKIIAAGLGAVLAAGGVIGGYEAAKGGSGPEKSQTPVVNETTPSANPTSEATLVPNNDGSGHIVQSPKPTDVKLVPNNNEGGHIARSPQPSPTEATLVPNTSSEGHIVQSPQPSETAVLVPNNNDGGHIVRSPQ